MVNIFKSSDRSSHKQHTPVYLAELLTSNDYWFLQLDWYSSGEVKTTHYFWYINTAALLVSAT